jgi:hypothetical protein
VGCMFITNITHLVNSKTAELFNKQCLLKRHPVLVRPTIDQP